MNSGYTHLTAKQPKNRAITCATHKYVIGWPFYFIITKGLKMDVLPVKTVVAGESGYRTPTKHGTIDVFYKNKRYVFTAPVMQRTAWREVVAKLILGPRGKSSDLVALNKGVPADLRRNRHSATAYRVGKLDKPPIRVRRQPGDDPLYTTGGKRKAGARELLILVDTFRAGDPRREVAGWGKRRGCFLAVDMLTGHAFLFRHPEGGRGAARAMLVMSWAVGDGPPVEVRGTWPAYGVMARGWTAEEKRRIAAARGKAGRDSHFDKQMAEYRAREASDRRAAVARERSARGRIAEKAKRVTLAGISLRRAEASEVLGEAGPERVAEKRRELELAWDDYHRQVAIDSGWIKGARPVAKPSGPGVRRLPAIVPEVPRIVT